MELSAIGDFSAEDVEITASGKASVKSKGAQGGHGMRQVGLGWGQARGREGKDAAQICGRGGAHVWTGRKTPKGVGLWDCSGHVWEGEKEVRPGVVLSRIGGLAGCS
eukprot:363895-Chlamydomonas_euryale.AAC.1